MAGDPAGKDGKPMKFVSTRTGTPKQATAGHISSAKVLVVDDEAIVRSSVVGYLSLKGFSCLEAANVDDALGVLAQEGESIGVVLSDLKMPGKSGIDLLAEVRKRDLPDLEFLVMTGHGDTASAIAALRHGASDFLLKPVDFTHLFNVIQQAGERYDRHRSQRTAQKELMGQVRRKAMEAQALAGQLDAADEDSARHLAVAAEFRDTETGAHNSRIGIYAGILAEALGWSEEQRHLIELAAPLHDVGKIGIPDRILMKSGRLTDEEFETIKSHCAIGHRILSVSHQPTMKCAAEIALCHHERWNGGGYPNNLKGEEIPINARIVAICDVYDALRSLRPYKSALGHEDVVRIILEGDDRTRPDHYDPQLLELFRRNAHRFDEVFSRSQDDEEPG